MNDSIFKLMAFYIIHRNWRARVSMNEAASWIWVLWLLAIMQALFSLYAVITGMYESAVILAVGALAVFVASFLFAPAAKRKHAALERTRNTVLFGPGNAKV